MTRTPATAPGNAASQVLPRPRFATGGAITNTFRQIGAALGISILIAILGTTASDDLSVFHRAWALMALTGALSGLIGLRRRKPWSPRQWRRRFESVRGLCKHAS